MSFCSSVVGLIGLFCIALGAPSSANAGSYRVAACQAEAAFAGNWGATNNNGGITLSDTCVNAASTGYLEVAAWTNVGATGYGQWRFSAPSYPSTSIVGLIAQAKLQRQGNYRSTLYVDGGDGRVDIGTGSTSGVFQVYNWSGGGRQNAIAELYCTTGGCPDPSGSHTRVKNITVTLSDNSGPSITSGLSGSLVSGGGKRGSHSVSYAGADNAGGGLESSRLLIDGVTNGSTGYSCDTTSSGAARTASFPCAQSRSPSYSVNTDTLSEGTHGVQGCVEDFADGGGHEACTSGSFRVDRTAPSLSVTSPAASSYTADTTPNLAGAAGSATGDSSQLTVRVYSGSSASGSPIQTHTVSRSGSSWSVDANSLSNGTYTVQATQSDDVPNTGTSNTRTFTVDTTAPNVTITNPPSNGHEYNVPAPTFSGSAGNAANDSQQVEVKVWQGTDTGVAPVQQLTTNRVGSSWTAQTTDPLPDGNYTVRAFQTDSVGNQGQSVQRAFTVDAIGSDECSSASSTTIADGFAGSMYVTLRIAQNQDETVVCYRAQDGPLPYLGGNFVIRGGPQLNPPRTDESSELCAPHTAAGEIGPDNTPYAIDSHSTTGETWICVQVGSVKRRVIVPAQSGLNPPDVEHKPDVTPIPAPPATEIEAANPSATCQQTAGESGRVANFEAAEGRLFLYRAQPATTHAQLCVRYQGTAALGGMLSVDATGSPGSPPLNLREDANSGFCTVNVINQTSPEHLRIRIQPDGPEPSVCIEALGDSNPSKIRKRAYVEQGGTLIPPRVSFAPDPGTPIPPIGP